MGIGLRAGRKSVGGGPAGEGPAGDGPADPAELKQLETRIRGMAADLAASTCEWLHLLERFDRENGWAGVGIASCAAWLSWTCSVAPGTAREYMRVARALPLLPLVDAAFAAGRLSYSKVRLLVKVAGVVDEKTLLEQAQVQTVAQLERTIRAFRRSNGWSQQLRRTVSWRWDDDGMFVLTARLPADEGALLLTALEQGRVPEGERQADGSPKPGETSCAAMENKSRDGGSGGRQSGEPGVGSADASVDGLGGGSAGVSNGDDDVFGVSAFDDDAFEVRTSEETASVGPLPTDDDRQHAALTGVDPADVARAEMLVALARRALAAGNTDSSGDDRHLVVVHADIAQLTAGSDLGVAAVATDGGAADGTPTEGAGGEGAGGGAATGAARAARAVPVAAAEAGRNGAGGLAGPVGTLGPVGTVGPVGTLPGPRCHIENGPGLDPRTLSRLACDASFVAVLHHVGEGEPLRLGRKTRDISPAQRRALRIRDGGCRFPGCHRLTHLEAHHVRPWSLFGPTDLDNLVLLCRFHHMLIHEGGFSVAPGATDAPGARRSGGAARAACGWDFRDPAGESIPAAPPLPRSALDGAGGAVSTVGGGGCGRTDGSTDGWGSVGSWSDAGGENGRDDGPSVRHASAPHSAPVLPARADDPFGLLPLWRGEPFHVAETVAALCRSPRVGV